MRQHLMDGLYVFNKPVGISSAGFLNKIKKQYAVSKIGHGGTLDPFASGVLVVGVGREYTGRLSETLTQSTKEYEAAILLGASSSTDDGTGEIEKSACVASPSPAAIERACAQLQKQTKQLPPRFSAVKIGGVPAYAHARRGESIALEPKDVVVHEYRISDVRKKSGGLTEVDAILIVSSGFYVRSFARDLGELLGVGGYVDTLTRTRVGNFSLEQALTFEDISGGVEACVRWEGRVQGIGFRDFVRTTAERHHLTGWVRNLPDGSVEGVVQGTMAQLDSFIKNVGVDHAYARIEKTFISFQKPARNLTSFSIEA